MKKFLILILVVLVVGCGSSQPGSWTGYGRDATRSLLAGTPGPSRPRLVWVAELDAKSPGSPVTDEDGNIYVPHSTGSIAKLDARGRIQWQLDSWVSDPQGMPPELVLMPHNYLLMSTQGAREQTFRVTTNGETITGPEFLPYPASRSVAMTQDGYGVFAHQFVSGPNSVGLKLYGLSHDGKTLWIKEFSQGGVSYMGSIPVISESGSAWAFIETNQQENKLLQIDNNGQVISETKFLAQKTMGVGVAIAAGKDRLFFGTARIEDIQTLHSPGYIYAVDEQGEYLWRKEAGQRVVQLMVAPKMVVANVLRTKLMALDYDGEELWEFALGGWESNGVMDSRGRVYMVGIKEGNVWLRAVDRGREIWEFDTGQQALATSYLILHDGVLYVGTDTGKILAISD